MSYPIKGIPTRAPNGFTPLRPDIDVWYSAQTNGDEIQLSLFILALEKIQKLDHKRKLSFFSIAGIHSAPRNPWDGAPDPSEYGYCVHNDVTFPTWHRVYMTLMEQVLYENMCEIVASVPYRARKRWQEQADLWRLPYWDFARYVGDTKEVRLPILCMMPEVDVWEPCCGRFTSRLDQKRKKNPLYTYDAGQLMGQLGIEDECSSSDFTVKYPWSKCQATTKHGLFAEFDDDVWQNAGQNWDKVNTALNERVATVGASSPVGTLRSEVYRLFSHDFGNWGAFASTKYLPTQPEAVTDNLSLEFVHNQVHDWTGGYNFVKIQGHEKYSGAGHMCSVAVAAFDPIFFIYHCNIDRLTAIWQALNEDSWFDDPREGDTLPTANLAPFHKDKNHTPYTSNDVRSWKILGYDYEILQDPGSGKLRSKAAITAEINRLYGDTEIFKMDTEHIPRSMQKTPRFGNAHHDYVVNVVYDRYALNGVPYKIFLFVGHPIENGTASPEMEYYVGSVYTFSSNIGQTPGSQCRNCIMQKQQGILSSATIPMTEALRIRIGQERDGLVSLDPKDVITYLGTRPLKFVVTDGSSRRQNVTVRQVALYHGSVRYPLRDDGFDHENLPYFDRQSYSKLADGTPAVST